MRVRRLSEDGIVRMVEFLDSLATDRPADYPDDLVEHDELTDPIEPTVDVELVTFKNRLDVASYLDRQFADTRLQGIEGDKGVWAWLALFYFYQLCGKNREGDHAPGEVARWVPENDNFRKYYRHLLRGPFSIYRAHKEEPQRALALLCGPLAEPGDVVEQLSARQELVTNAGVVKTATILYYDTEKQSLKRGAAGRGPGSARRLADLFNQLDVTWDLYGMSAEQLIALLPTEFNRFRSAANR